jgi:putative FmdB family regulatory protein
MPTYEYECETCHHHFEIFQNMSDAKLSTCPECGKESLERLIGTGSGVHFKGSGFYQTDYKKSDKSSD